MQWKNVIINQLWIANDFNTNIFLTSFLKDPVEHDDVVVDFVVGKPGVGGYGGAQVEHTIYNSYIRFS